MLTPITRSRTIVRHCFLALFAACYAACLLLSGCSTAPVVSSANAIPAATHPWHPTGWTGRPLCSNCHDGALPGTGFSYRDLDHTRAFCRDHRTQGGSNSWACDSCHLRSFCSDCHGATTGIKPSLLYPDRPDRELPHRGHYLTTHQLEGKADPASCYRCHGRANNTLCRSCHR